MAVIIKNLLSSIALVVLAITSAGAKHLYGEIPADNTVDEMIQEHQAGLLSP